MSNLFNRLTFTCLLVLALITNAGLLFANQSPTSESSTELQDQLSAEVSGTQLAMNDPDALVNKEKKDPTAQTGPVLLVPMVLAVLALVAVSRRKEG